MLTGDKQGTAVNIGKSCGLVDPTYEVRYVTSKTRPDIRRELEVRVQLR
jgi:magnesium-transporting ATPase (P-type)